MALEHKDPDNGVDEVRAAAWSLVGVTIPADCAPGVKANLAIIGRHVEIVRAADIDPALEAAEVFQA
jgi:hypothetical protein